MASRSGVERCRPRIEPVGAREGEVAVETEASARKHHVPSPGPCPPPFGRPCRLYTVTRARRVLGYLRERFALSVRARGSAAARFDFRVRRFETAERALIDER